MMIKIILSLPSGKTIRNAHVVNLYASGLKIFCFASLKPAYQSGVQTCELWRDIHVALMTSLSPPAT